MVLSQNQGVILPPLTVFVIKSILKITYNYLINLMQQPSSQTDTTVIKNIIMMQDYTIKYTLTMYFLQNIIF